MSTKMEVPLGKTTMSPAPEAVLEARDIADPSSQLGLGNFFSHAEREAILATGAVSRLCEVLGWSALVVRQARNYEGPAADPRYVYPGTGGSLVLETVGLRQTDSRVHRVEGLTFISENARFGLSEEQISAFGAVAMRYEKSEIFYCPTDNDWRVLEQQLYWPQQPALESPLPSEIAPLRDPVAA